jgi:hypothetical protein
MYSARSDSLSPDNVEYNEIKHLIKVRTTRDQAHAISIPGRGNGENATLNEFEDELYAELSEQHQRIDLFVFSKSGEISRRLSKSLGIHEARGIVARNWTGLTRTSLDHLDKQVIQLQGRSKTSARIRMSVKRLEKFSKVEGEVLKCVLGIVHEPFPQSS